MPSHPRSDHEVIEILSARGELIAVCEEFDSWARHPGNAEATDEVVGNWYEAISLKALVYADRVRGLPPTERDGSIPPPTMSPAETRRHLRSVKA